MNKTFVAFLSLCWCFLISGTTINAQNLQAQPTTVVSEQHRLLETLNRLRQEGLISEALYHRKKQSINISSDSNNYIPVSTEVTRSKHNSKTIETRTDDGRYIALVIGNNDYQFFDPLAAAVNDAKAVTELLRDKFGFHVTLMQNLRRHELIDALAEFRKTLLPRDNFLLYYAGHGYLDPETRRGFWLPVDAGKSSPANWVSTIEISDALLALPVQKALVIADSCFASSLAVKTPDISYPSSINVNTSDGQTMIPRSRTVITSGGLEPVLDSIDGEHSVFARALLNEMKNFDTTSTIGGLFEQVARRVQREADQTPEYFAMQSAGHQAGEFEFRVVR